MEILEKIFGNNTHIRVILLFYNNNGRYFNNITGLAKRLDKSHVTMRKVVSDLLDVGILTEIEIGKSRVIMINENSPYTEALFNFIHSMQDIKANKRIEEIIEVRSR
ncbi:MAG: hypothetical protein H0M93_02625 [Methanophagales archaeon]|nr:hypothetical protein [Methanophagales archaeon]